MVAGLGVPALIVTLGSMSLFRGVAEGMTHAAVNYSGFPADFLRLGQGYLWGIVPAQAPVFAIVFVAYAVLLHRSVVGRALYAIGFAAAGARYAGIPVASRVALVYVLSGTMASVAALVYVAHLGQAKSDAGTPRGAARRDRMASAASSQNSWTRHAPPPNRCCGNRSNRWRIGHRESPTPCR